jgi:hypothetical protein
MKAYSNYTTTLTTVAWFRRGTPLLLALAALMLGLMLLWRTNGQSALPLAISDSFTRPAFSLIPACRPCWDESVAAQAAQPALAGSARQPLATTARRSASRANSPVDACRVCRDEWIAAKTAGIPTGGVTFDQPVENGRTSGPR